MGCVQKVLFLFLPIIGGAFIGSIGSLLIYYLIDGFTSDLRQMLVLSLFPILGVLFGIKVAIDSNIVQRRKNIPTRLSEWKNQK